MNQGNSYWVENNIKARIAETIIKELFIKLGYEVYHYGMENAVPALTGKLSGLEDETSMQIRRMPDLVVIDKKEKRSFYLEVKFRFDGIYPAEKDNVDDNPFDNAVVVVVSKKHIKCLTVNELKKGRKLRKNPNPMNYLGSRKEFNFNEDQKEVIREFREYALKYFECVND